MKRWLRTLSNKTKTGLMVVTLLTAQVASAGLPFMPKVEAAVVSSNVSSTGFVIKNGTSYSTVAGQPTATGQFKNGNVGAYPEGACIPAVFQVTNNSGATGDLLVTPVIDYSQVGTSQRGFTDIETTTSSLTDVTTATNLNQMSFPGIPLSSATSFQTTTGATVSATVSGAYAGNDSSTTPTSTSDTFRHYNVTLLNVANGVTVNVLVCGRLGLDASQYNGSSLSIRTVQGGQENVPIPVNQILVLPSITVNKTITAGSALPSDFSFTVSPAVNGQSVFTIPVGQSSVTVQNVNPDGVYTVTESGPSGYRFTGGTGTSCTVVAATVGTAAGQMSATVAAGKPPTDATCNFTNTLNTGTIMVTKVVNNTHGGTATASQFPLFVNSTQVTSGASNTYNAGQSYTVSETANAVAGYTQTGATCVDASTQASLGTTFTLGTNQNVSCTITNADVAPTLKLVKQVSGGTALPGDWTLSATSSKSNPTLTGKGDTFGFQTAFANDTYTLSEAGGPSGYTAGAWSCDGGTQVGSTITLGLASNVTCTITNTRDTGTLTVNKVINPSTDTGLFNLAITGPTNYTQPNQGNGGTTGAQTVDTGSYTVSETAGTGTTLANYLASYVCMNGSTTVASGTASSSTTFTVAKGQNIVCTFTNVRYGSIAGVKYEVNADGSTVRTLGGWIICLDANNNGVCDPSESTQQTSNTDGSFSFTGLLPGTYSLLENLLSGWTQIFHPSPVNLAAGQNSTGNNFGNFQNSSISGFKFNDLDGNHAYDTGEPKLSGWTIFLDANGNGTLDNGETSTTTDASGNYSFTDLTNGTYSVCEVQQTGWTETYPTSTACHTVVVSLSGTDYSNMNFGNRAYGTLTVIKDVDDGFGNVALDATGWTWNYDGLYQSGTKVAASSTKQVTVPAGSYSITENQQPDYHFTSLVCNDRAQDGSTGHVTVSANSNIVCTFTNTRDTGSITVDKVVDPSEGDDGLFNLNIVGPTNYTKADQANGGSTGAQTVLTGTYQVSETAGTNTNLSDYDSSYECSNEVSGTGTITPEFSVGYQDDITCVFTNTRHAQLTVIKKAFPANSAQSFNFTLTKITPVLDEEVQTETNDQSALNMLGTTSLVKNFQLDDNTDPTLPNSDTTALSAGVYEVSEDSTPGWNLVSMDCGNVVTVKTATSIRFELQPGQQLTCTFTNQKPVVPQVLSDTTVVLTNTGLPIIAYVMASLTIVGVALFTYRRQTS